MNYLYCIIGKSGVGKTTVATALQQEYGLKSIDSYTTRPRRSENEVGHIFVSNKEFEVINQDLVAYTFFDNNHYGVTLDQIEESDIYVVDWVGYQDLLKNYEGNKIIKSVYLDAKESVLLSRMLRRENDYLKAQTRIHHDKMKFNKIKKKCDYCIENTLLNKTIQEFKRIMDYNNSLKG